MARSSSRGSSDAHSFTSSLLSRYERERRLPNRDQNNNLNDDDATSIRHDEGEDSPPNRPTIDQTNENYEPPNNEERLVNDSPANRQVAERGEEARNDNVELQANPSEGSRPLDEWDVGALILNKMVGTGIFTAPPSVLILTGSAKAALGLWIGGFFYTLLR
jgi:hypothetical protein